jgi:hypothetical protein
MLAALFNDDALLAGVRVSLADRCAGCGARARADHRAVAAADFMAEHCARCAANGAADHGVTALVEIGASSERGAHEQSECCSFEHGRAP